MRQSVRPPAVAGLFYPGDATELKASVRSLLGEAETAPPVRELPAVSASTTSAPLTTISAAHSLGGGSPQEVAPLRAVIAPHAGYIYSGLTAAFAYNAVAREADRFGRVILLGPTHRVAVDGLALPGADALATPLGVVEVDTGLEEKAAAFPQVVTEPLVHRDEHSLEVHLPFLQEVLPGRPVLPLAVGRATASQVADVLSALLDDPAGEDALVVVSSDLSHYLAYDEAVARDEATLHQALALDTSITHYQACGATPMIGLLELARRRSWTPEVLDLRNSGDTAGDRGRVVGYPALSFRNTGHGATGRAGALSSDRLDDRSNQARGAGDADAASPDPLASLPILAREAIYAHLTGDPAPAALTDPTGPGAERLRAPGASFVTLNNHSDGSLRGCIGSLVAHQPLGRDVAAHAVDAATRDSRFSAVTLSELPELTVEVSVLSEPEPFASGATHLEDEALALLRPGVDGVIFAAGPYTSTFLPQVWRQLPDPRVFMDHLRRKAGLPGNYWGAEVTLLRYTVTEYRDNAQSEDDGAENSGARQ